MRTTKLYLNPEWQIFLEEEINSSNFQAIISKLEIERRNHTILPKDDEIFNALNYTSVSKLKIVILGQDPYHAEGQAHGLSFSVPMGIKTPPSLRNIFKELQADLNIPISSNGNLSAWAEQGVLLLNATLTVREKKAGSHQKLGWEDFTDAVISKLSSDKDGLIFMLWGASAQKKLSLINNKKHYILKTTHPSPFSAYRGFLGCKHFSKTNNILIKNNQKPIDWNLCSDTLTLF